VAVKVVALETSRVRFENGNEDDDDDDDLLISGSMSA
jgi:hypothetical protein